jgi:hypothetical protein
MRNIPIKRPHKCQIAVKCTEKFHLISKIGIFGTQYIPSGNPGPGGVLHGDDPI